jgi:hypothetical protein
MTMPRSVEEILAHADELAQRFEDYEPDPADERDVAAISALRQAAMERSAAEAHVRDAVRQAREHKVPWTTIGTFLGTSGEAARQRYGRLTA